MHVCRFDGDLRQGLTTALCLGTDETWAAAATSSGLVSVWDLRYKTVSGTSGTYRTVVEPREGTSFPPGSGCGCPVSATPARSVSGDWCLGRGRDTSWWPCRGITR